MEEEKKAPKVEENKEKADVKETKKEEVKKDVKKQEEAKGTTSETTKKKNQAKNDNKKMNNNTIIGIAITAVAVIVVIAIACIFLKKDSPKKVVESTLKDLKTGTYTQQMLSGLMGNEESFDVEAQKLLFNKLQWKVLSEKEEGDKATVEVEITNKDFKTIIANYTQKALKAAFSGTTNEEEITNYLIEELQNEDIQTVTANGTIELEKKDGKWEISGQDQFINVVLPGLYDAVNAYNN